jgi:3-methyladenine DNA glycosylase AlkD
LLNNLLKDLNKASNKPKAQILARFFKTGPGEYGEGDVFLGITVPKQRAIAKRYGGLPLLDVQKLLQSKIHEHRLVALMILVDKYENPLLGQGEGGVLTPGEVVSFYLKNLKHINNWDLVDLSAPNIVGDYLLDRPKTKLYNLVKSKNIWERRVSVLATYPSIRQNNFTDILKLSRILLSDQEDLIHKACGWMLREAGKRDEKVLRKFLDQFVKKMPRTMLRYAIERFDESENSCLKCNSCIR